MKKRLFSLILSACLVVSSIVVTPAVKSEAASIPSNANLLNTYGNVFNYVGTALVQQELLNPTILNRAAYEYNSITVGNEMKPDYVLGWNATTMSVSQAKAQGYYIPSNYRESVVPRIDCSSVDKMMKACYEKGLKMRGHTLLWHAQTPDWFFKTGFSRNGSYVDKETMYAREEFFIKNYLGHCCKSQYASVIYAWDVVNEYVHAPSNASGWQKIYGNTNGGTAEYIKKAFQFAYETLEANNMTNSVHLFYNDFNTYMDVNKIVTLVNYINQGKKICAGVGMQSHLSTDFPSVSYYKSALSTFCKQGYEVQITELDAGSPDSNTQAKYYYDLFRAILDVKKSGGNITAIVWWGMTDDTSWRSKDRPLLYSTYGQKKAAYNSVLQAYFDAGYKMDTNYNNQQPTVTPTQTPTIAPAQPTVTGKVNDGWYYIKGIGSQKYLQVTNNNGQAGANIEIGTKSGRDGQIWKVTNLSDGYITLTSKLGDYMMDVAYGSADDNANVGLYNAYSGEAQQFILKEVSNGVYTINTKCSDGQKVLDVAARSTADGANVCQYRSNGQTNQQWSFEPVGGVAPTQVPTVAPTQAPTVAPTQAPTVAPTQAPTVAPTQAPTVSPTQTPIVDGKLAVKYTINSWGSGYQVSFKVSNNGTASINTWTLKVKKSDCKISTSWNINVKESGDYYVITPVSWNSQIPAGGSVEFGILGEGSIGSSIECSIN